MVFGANKFPSNEKLKDYFSWRETSILDHQKADLYNKFFTEIALKGLFPAYVIPSNPLIKNDDGKSVFPKGTKLNYVVMKTKNGDEYFPVFTSREEMEQFQKPDKANITEVLVSFDDFVPILSSNISFDGIVINPFSDNFVIHRKVVAKWVQQKSLVMAKLKEAQEAKKAEQEKKEEE